MCVRLPGDMHAVLNSCIADGSNSLDFSVLAYFVSSFALSCPFHLVYVNNANRVDGYDGVLNPSFARIENLAKRVAV